MPDYSQGKIYKVFLEEEVYYGSTCSSLGQRYSQHKHQALNYKCECAKLFADGKTPEIELVEEYPCENARELKSRER